MKLINTLALIAGAMVITTEAVKLETKGEEASLAERFVELLFDVADSNKDGNLDVEEFQGIMRGMQDVYDAAAEADHNEDG